MIRFATYDDIDLLLKLSYEFWKSSPYTNQKYDKQATEDTFVEAVAKDNNESILLVSENPWNELEGFLLGTAVNPLFSKDLAAYEVAYYVRADSEDWYELIKAYVFWARRIGCTTVQFGSVNPRLTRILEKRLGFTAVETTLQKGL